ncbi:MAG: hypothetical protein DRJ96_00100 [Thermoprotei archaeon]|nr:MAG: hypothetical protein DRJ67_01870 [Thermoprotei archaeon]RLE98773.1 MAG: hypothetical protein DRJ96_00100 [Thermoprotei archaeon]
MPWIGVAEEVSEEEAREAIRGAGLFPKKVIGTIEIKTGRGWVKFRVYEVEGSVEGVAELLAPQVNAPVFESGRHLILGEASARLWDEGAKIVFPDGVSEVVPIFTFDGFLDVRMPTDNVKGLKATIVVGGRTYELPLKLSDLVEIYSMGRKALEKVEKAASVYGLEKVISRDALEELKKRRERVVKVEVDYETGFVLILEGDRIRTAPLKNFFLDLIHEGKVERAKEILEGAPEQVRRELLEALKEDYEASKAMALKERQRAIEEAARKLGLAEELGLEGDGPRSSA